MSSPVSLAFEDVSKWYGRQPALDKLSFSVPAGSTCALIGANGAGKTTSFSLVGGFQRRFAGKIGLAIKGYGSVSLRSYRAGGGVIGLMPQDVQCFEDRTVFSQLVLFSRLAGRSKLVAAHEVAELLEATDLVEHQHKLPRELSHGMRARFGIAQAFVGAPGLVLLDEPTAGLDPLHLAQMRELLTRFRGRTTLVVSSHDLRELQSWCDYVVMMERGTCIKHGPLTELVQNEIPESRWVIRGAFSLPALVQAFQGLEIAVQTEYAINPLVVTMHGALDGSAVASICTWFFAHGCEVVAFDRAASLERAYLREIT